MLWAVVSRVTSTAVDAGTPTARDPSAGRNASCTPSAVMHFSTCPTIAVVSWSPAQTTPQ